MAKKKKYIFFPQSCFGCDGIYTHGDMIKLCTGGCMKTYGDSYCTKVKKHFKLTNKNLNEKRPEKCPIVAEFPIVIKEDNDY